MNFDNKTVTYAGANLLAHSDSEKKATVVDSIIISSNSPAQSADYASLSFNDFGDYKEFPVVNIRNQENVFQPEAVITNVGMTNPFPLVMVGLKAHTDGEPNSSIIAVAVGDPDDPFTIPAQTSVPYQLYLDQPIGYSNAANVKMNVNNAGMVTSADVNQAISIAITPLETQSSHASDVSSLASATQLLSSGTSSNVSSLSNAISSVASAAGSNSAITSSFATIQSSVNANNSNIAIIESSVASNSSNISINSSNIAVNSSNISTLQTSVSSNASSIASGNSQMVSLQNQVNGVLARQSAIIQQLVNNTGVSADSLVSTLKSNGTLNYNYGTGSSLGNAVYISTSYMNYLGTLNFNYYPTNKILIISGNNFSISNITGYMGSFAVTNFSLSSYLNTPNWTATIISSSNQSAISILSIATGMGGDVLNSNTSTANFGNFTLAYKINL